MSAIASISSPVLNCSKITSVLTPRTAGDPLFLYGSMVTDADVANGRINTAVLSRSGSNSVDESFEEPTVGHVARRRRMPGQWGVGAGHDDIGVGRVVMDPELWPRHGASVACRRGAWAPAVDDL